MAVNLNNKTLRHLAEMICGNKGNDFVYRSSTHLTQFFADCGLPHVHDGSTRFFWVLGVLDELNGGTSSNPQLPSDDLIRVVQELFDPYHFNGDEQRTAALGDVNDALKRDGLRAYLDSKGRAQVHRVDGGADSTTIPKRGREWSPDEKRKLDSLAGYLASASEDEFTDNLLVPLLSRLGFRRLSVTGHRDKALEYGNDLWMKFQLPTAHFLYFGAQVKKGTIDAAGRSKGDRCNVTEVLNQVRMLVDHPIFDPEVGRKVLMDHVFVISTGNITKQARNWLVEQLDESKRRHLIFMDREEILSLVMDSAMALPESSPSSPRSVFSDDDIPV